MISPLFLFFFFLSFSFAFADRISLSGDDSALICPSPDSTIAILTALQVSSNGECAPKNIRDTVVQRCSAPHRPCKLIFTSAELVDCSGRPGSASIVYRCVAGENKATDINVGNPFLKKRAVPTDANAEKFSSESSPKVDSEAAADSEAKAKSEA